MAFQVLSCPFDGCTRLAFSLEQETGRLKIDCPDCQQSVSAGLGDQFQAVYDSTGAWRT